MLTCDTLYNDVVDGKIVLVKCKEIRSTVDELVRHWENAHGIKVFRNRN